jgi:uncharacterized protein YbjT (DUF2867 family)
MTILITGGTGTTGLILAKLASSKGHKVLLTSRSGKAPEPFKAVTFDWNDTTTFENPFSADPDISSIYLVAPPVYAQVEVVGPFVDLAIAKGIKRFVLLSGTGLKAGDPTMGKIHEHLIKRGVEYTVLRATDFSQNFGTFFRHLIQTENAVISIAGDGKIPFVAVEDIAEAALDGLTSDKPANADYFVVGPELFTYDEAVKLLSNIIGREIVHRRIPVEEYQDILHSQFGFSKRYAAFLIHIEAEVANGSEVKVFNAPDDKKIVGKITLGQYFKANAAIWAV